MGRALVSSPARPSPSWDQVSPDAPQTPLHTDLGTCHSALGEGAEIWGPKWEAWGAAVEGPSHCRVLDGAGGRGEGSEPKLAPIPGCSPGLSLAKPPVFSDF